MYPTSMTEEDKKWQRRSDARTLAEAEAIRSDKERMAGAQQGAREILQEKTDELKGLTAVASSQKASKAVKAAQRVSRSTPAPTQSGGSFPQPSRGSVLDRHSNPATLGRLFK